MNSAKTLRPIASPPRGAICAVKSNPPPAFELRLLAEIDRAGVTSRGEFGLLVARDPGPAAADAQSPATAIPRRIGNRIREEDAVASKRGVVYMGPGKVEIQSIDYPD